MIILRISESLFSLCIKDTKNKKCKQKDSWCNEKRKRNNIIKVL